MDRLKSLLFTQDMLAKEPAVYIVLLTTSYINVWAVFNDINNF